MSENLSSSDSVPAPHTRAAPDAPTRADLDKQPAEVASMFDDVAGRYDLLNSLLSLGQDRVWRRRLVAALNVSPGEKVLDLAAGTGTSTQPFADLGAEAVACDFSPGMIEEGKRRRPELTFVAGDAMNLPFAENTFDAVTISFGLRNVADPAAGLAEMYRVTKPGGRVAIMEFSAPVYPPFNRIYTEYLMRALPPVARAISANPEAYVYLAESIRAWPNQDGLAHMVAAAGFTDVRYRNLSAGIVAIHYGIKVGEV